MYTLIEFQEKEKWQRVIGTFKNSDIYFQWGYISSFKIHGDGAPFLFLYEDRNGRVANIFFLRDISKLDSFENKIETNRFFDISSVYGYGGPLYEGENLEVLAINYTYSFNKFCFERNIVSEFIRFNPLIENHRLFMDLYDLTPIRKTIYLDLSKGEEYIWDNLKSENRTRIRKAIKNGIEVIKGRDVELIYKFIELYNQTMDRDKAAPYYYFENEFYNVIQEELYNNFLIFAAKYKEKIISASLVLFSDQYIHYHLGGSETEFMNLAPNNLLFFEIAIWASKKGIKKFHLGGGYSGNDDSLFRFKKSFSKLEPLDFYIGRKIHNEQIYNELINIRKENDFLFNDSNQYFPKYRG